MSIQYRTTPLKDNISEDPKKGFYAQVVTKGTVNTKQLCEEISSGCTLTVADLKAAIEALTSSVELKLQDGYNVCIDELGTFSVSAQSVVSEDENGVRSPAVKVKKINFRPSVRFKKNMSQTKFVKAPAHFKRK